MLGKLTIDAVPYHEPIIMVTVAAIVIGGLALLALITYFGKWKWLWSDWLTSVDHKKIGIMYIIVAMVMLLRGFADAIMMRSQQALASAGEAGFLPPHHYDQIFTAHGVIMIFFMAMPFVVGLMNVVVPLQIGARDVAFPFLNSLSFWFFVVGVVLINISLGVGEFAQTGWLAYPPLSGKEYSPGVGVDYWIWSLQISGIGTLLTGVNFFATILKMRAPGMPLMKMPVFTWAALCTNVLIIVSFPILTVTIALLTLDRYLGTHFFTNDMGGNMMMYINLIWCVLRSHRDLLEKTSVRLYLTGMGNHRDYRSVVHRMAAPLLYHGVRRERKRLLRYCHHDHFHPYRGENLQLAVHHVPRPHSAQLRYAVDHRLHHHLLRGWYDRCSVGRAGRELRAAQQSVPDCPLP